MFTLQPYLIDMLAQIVHTTCPLPQQSQSKNKSFQERIWISKQ